MVILPKRPLTYEGLSFVGWALYQGESDDEPGQQAEMLALTDSQAKVWLAGDATRTVVPVYSDTWFYATK